MCIFSYISICPLTHGLYGCSPSPLARMCAICSDKYCLRVDGHTGWIPSPSGGVAYCGPRKCWRSLPLASNSAGSAWARATASSCAPCRSSGPLSAGIGDARRRRALPAEGLGSPVPSPFPAAALPALGPARRQPLPLQERDLSVQRTRTPASTGSLGQGPLLAPGPASSSCRRPAPLPRPAPAEASACVPSCVEIDDFLEPSISHQKAISRLTM